jgi:hypothetical protein
MTSSELLHSYHGAAWPCKGAPLFKAGNPSAPKITIPSRSGMGSALIVSGCQLPSPRDSLSVSRAFNSWSCGCEPSKQTIAVFGSGAGERWAGGPAPAGRRLLAILTPVSLRPKLLARRRRGAAQRPQLDAAGVDLSAPRRRRLSLGPIATRRSRGDQGIELPILSRVPNPKITLAEVVRVTYLP